MLALDLPVETPTTPQDVAEVVARGRPLEIVGGGTKRRIGAVRAAKAVLSLAKLDKVVDYQPEELVLTVQPGAKLSVLEKLVAAEGQMLPFEPPKLTRLLGAKGQSTIGGVVATGLSGPRRIRAGAARDHVLGISAVTGRGEIVKAGGKVVKNVTGYDLSKLVAGSWGTLAVLTEVTLKVLPAAKTETTLLLFGLSEERASMAMQRAMNAPAEVSGAAHLPAATAARAPLKAHMPVTALRLEGFEASVAARAEALGAALQGFGRVDRLDAAHSREFWGQVREVEAFWRERRPLWRVSVPPAEGWRVADGIDGDALHDWAGGLVWLASEAPAAAIRARARELGGHAALYRGEGPAFGALDGPLAALSARVKAAFDPNGVLNPGRLAEG
jgi:glycolate oxidase FAD binding subunit